ncbi:MAG: DUF2066 domain-containing protein [Thiohalorhabdus sp.]
MHARPLVRLLILVFAVLLTGAGAHGGRVDQLYTAEAGTEDLGLVGVDPEEAKQTGDRPLRRDLMRAALARVLIRVAGTAEVAADAAMQEGLIERAPSLANQFQFLNRGGPEGPRIRVHFDPAAVREGLWRSDWPVWGALRPGILVWVAQRNGGSLELVGPDDSPEVFEPLRRAAARSGLPLVLPLMDGTDRRSLDGRDLLLEDWAAIGEASRRYDAEAVLILRLAGKGDRMRAEWVLQERQGGHAFTTSGPHTDQALANGMKAVLEYLARKHAVHPGEASTVRMVVDGLPGLGGFARVERALSRLVAVQTLAPERVAGDEARFRLAFRGPPQDAARILGLVDLLEPKREPVSAPGQGETETGDPGQGDEQTQGGDDSRTVDPRLIFTYRP